MLLHLGCLCNMLCIAEAAYVSQVRDAMPAYMPHFQAENMSLPPPHPPRPTFIIHLTLSFHFLLDSRPQCASKACTDITPL
jgi:hypothetical protein